MRRVYYNPPCALMSTNIPSYLLVCSMVYSWGSSYQHRTGGEKMLGVEERYYTPQEIADQLKVARKTVYRWLESGELRAIKFEREYRISESHIADFIERHLTGKE